MRSQRPQSHCAQKPAPDLALRPWGLLALPSSLSQGPGRGGTLQPISQSSLGEAVPRADRTADIAWTLKTPYWAPRVQNWGLSGGLVPVDLGRVDGDGGVQSPGTSTCQVSWVVRGEAAERSRAWLGCGWGWADSRTQHGGKSLLEKVMGCVRACVHVCAVFLTASPLTLQGAGR